MMNDPRPSPPIVINPDTRTIRPESSEGDSYFGLEPGANGTAAITRRALVEPEGYTWVRSSGRAATGVNYVPGECSGESIPNIWGFR